MTLTSGRFKFQQVLKEQVLFGNDLNPELTAILGVYFVQGILGLSSLAIGFFLKDDLSLSPVQVGALTGIGALPWVIKPVFGFISDGLPWFGYRRRPYLILSGLIGTLAWLTLATLVTKPWQAIIAIFLTSLSIAISDVIADSLVVERAKGESMGNAGSLQSLCWGISAIGGLITAYLSGWLLEHFSNQAVFGITALFPLLISAAAWLITEEPVEQGLSGKAVWSQVKELRQAITKKSILLPVLFIVLWQATPSTESALFFFTTNELGFEPEFLGRIRLVTSIAALVGIALYQKFLKTVPFRTMFGWSVVISTALGLTTLILVTHANRSLGIDDHWFALGDSLILTVMGKIAWMPVLVLCARLCPSGIEATFFALLMSISNFSGITSYELGAWLTHLFGVTETNFDNLWLLVLVANLSTLLPLPFLGWLPDGSAEDENHSEESQLEQKEETTEVTSALVS